MIEPDAGVLPLSPSVKAMVEVADEDVAWIKGADGDPIEELARDLHKALCAVAETAAQDVSMDCMFIYHAGAGARPFTQRYVATWMPGPRAKAELRGGHVDGQLFDVQRDGRGWPPPILRVPASVNHSLAFREPSVIDPPVLPVHPTYRLVGFRNDPALWVYDLE